MSPRALRSSVVIVGGLEAMALLPPLRGEPVCAATAYDAIGAVGAATARRPIAAVIVPDGAIEHPSGNIVDAIHRLDPAVRVVRIAIRGSEVAENGFDQVVSSPVAASALDEAVGLPICADGSSPATGEPRSSAPVVESPAIPEQPAAPAPPPKPAPPEGSPPRRQRKSDRLGDVDLVDAVLSSDLDIDVDFDIDDDAAPTGGDLLNTALLLARQESGWPDLRLTDGDVGAAVGPNARYGRLASDAAPPDGLERWANWLARWLELDHVFRRHRCDAYIDELTGAWNRRYFNSFLDATLDRARGRRRVVTLMVFDIDDFKRYNDEYGHEAGDVILCETVSLLRSVIRKCDRVCRIGGDEFAVIFADLEEPREAGSMHPDRVETIARRFQSQVSDLRFPKLGLAAPGDLSISAGLAAYPWDGQTTSDLLRLADERALESKRRGKNHITFGPGAL